MKPKLAAVFMTVFTLSFLSYAAKAESLLYQSGEFAEVSEGYFPTESMEILDRPADQDSLENSPADIVCRKIGTTYVLKCCERDVGFWLE